MVPYTLQYKTLINMISTLGGTIVVCDVWQMECCTDDMADI